MTWPSAQPCGARRAERLGRSGGPGQRRPQKPRRSQLFPSRSFSRCFLPRMIRCRRASHPGPHRALLLFAAFHCLDSWPGWRRDFGESQLPSAILDRDPPESPFAHQHFCLRRRLPSLELIEPPAITHHCIVPDAPFVLQPEYPLQLRPARCWPMIVFRLCRPPREPLVVLGQIFVAQIHVRCFVTADLSPPQFLHQSVLVCPVNPLDSPLRCACVTMIRAYSARWLRLKAA